MMKTAELRTYHNFLILADELHFGRAADLSAITQPALSQQIARLEDSLGVKLFVRGQRQLALTPAGIVFRNGIAKLLGGFDRLAEKTVAAAGGADMPLAIGMTEYANLPLLAEAMIRLQQARPDARVARHELLHAQQPGALLRGQIDVGIGVVLDGCRDDLLHGPDVASRRVAASSWMLLVPAGHPWAGVGRLPLDALARERIVAFAREVNPPVYDGIFALCHSADIAPNVVFEATQSQFGIQLARSGMGVMLGTSFVLGAPPPGTVTVPLDGLPPLAVIANARRDECRPLVNGFLELLFAAGAAYRDPAPAVH
jgi:DNA-binding transcriptional LysR family regulator